MKHVLIAALIAVFSFGFGAVAADRLAVAEPLNKGGMKPEEVEAVWGMLEASVDGGYELISRSALKQMLTEIGLTDGSDLVNLNSSQKARLGEVKTVKYLLTSAVSRFGNRINFSMMVVDASTGEIDPARKTSETVNSLDELADKLKDMLREMGMGRENKKRGISAILSPLVTAPNAPSYLGEDFNTLLEATLLANQVKLQNLQSVGNILRKNHIAPLYEAEPAMFVRIGELLRVDFLIQATLSRFSFTFKKEYIKASKRTIIRCIGNFDGSIRIISAQTGEVKSVIPFRQKIDSDTLDSATTEDWGSEDYGKYMIEQIVPLIAAKVIEPLR